MLILIGVLDFTPTFAREWHAESHYRWATLDVPTQGRNGFVLLPGESTGLRFTNTLDEASGAANRVLYNGSGVATGDYDHDGLPDVFLCDLAGKNALFRNRGDGRFEDVTTKAGLGTPLPLTRGAVLADLNGDRRLDLLLSITGSGVRCFLNTGQGTFTDATGTAGTASKFGSTTMALADIDGNGTLDLYIANYRPNDIRDRGRVSISMVDGRPVMRGDEPNRFVILNGRLEECGQPDQLLLNDGTGRFKPVSWTEGAFLDETGRALTNAPLDWGLTATFRDVNADLAPDLYVCNDYWTPDRFWINDGRGHYRAIEPLALRRTSASSMSVDFADIDRDGNLDFFVVDMLSRFPHLRKRQMLAQTPQATPIGVIHDRPQVVQNTLFLSRGDGTFAEIVQAANLVASDWSWAPMFHDVDLDGFEDLLIGAGHFRDVQDYDAEAQVRARQHSWEGFPNETERQKAFTRELMEHYHLYPLLRMPIAGFHNRGDSTFEEVTEVWGLNHLGVHQGLAMADFDLDGDLDLVINNLNSPAMVFRNETTAGRVAVRLKGRAPNTQAIGAKIALLQGAIPRQTTEVVCGGHYQSGSDTQVVLATGNVREGMVLQVDWRSGTRTLLSNVVANRIYEIDEAGAEPVKRTTAPKEEPYFDDVSPLLAHTHQETAFNDYERQPLLPFKLSQLGPGIAWVDLDQDGHEDLVIGTGRGGAPSVFRSDGHGRFVAAPANPALNMANDTAGIVSWTDPTGATALILGATGYEVKGDHAARMFRWTGTQLEGGALIAPEIAGGGALALGDMNGDSQLELFIAGGVSPGHYPAGAPSKLCRFDGRQWKVDAKNSLLLENIGIVNGAVWSDLDGDGRSELILACEWGPLRVFRFHGGALFEVTQEWGLTPYSGWWRGVTTGDLNNDGRPDLIAANWGWNSPYQASAEKPLVFFYGQLAQPGVTEIVETEYVGSTLAPRRQFMALANSLPFLHEQFDNHKSFSEASLEQLLADRRVLARRVAVNTLSSMLFLNLGNSFKPVPLPREAQFSTAFSVNVADYNGDGHEDVFLSQNFFDLQPETTRIDAGLGLWLEGDGTGKLVAVPPAHSGVRVYGQQRGAALADYDEDGRIDLVVAQNGAATRLFHNMRAIPGLRVKLQGPPQNPAGIGAVIRLHFGGKPGPAREIHAGSGYWSQDSLTQVLAIPQQPEQLWIRWPGGRVTTTSLPPDLKEIVVNPEGKIISSR